MSWHPDDERAPSLFAKLRSLPTAVQVSGVVMGGVVLIDVIDRIKEIVLPLIHLITQRIGSCT